MLAWSPILIQQIEIHALGFVLRKLQLNRHRETEVAPHSHPYTQLILYLAGEGLQRIRSDRIDARGGDLFIIPPRVPHGFSVVGHSRPLCLVLDYDTARRAGRASHRRLPQHTLNELHTLLARVPTKGRPTLSDYPAIIAVVARLLEPHRAPPPPEPKSPPLYEKVRNRLREPGSLEVVARESGYARDALSRRLKREHGLGLRGIRDQLRLEAAQQSLREHDGVAEAAGRAGFDDANYFARWFRRKTGLTPSAWRKGQG
ncbi:MAG: AraC family transcriptional regulator [Opitutaceae bacterium]